MEIDGESIITKEYLSNYNFVMRKVSNAINFKSVTRKIDGKAQNETTLE